MTDVIKGEVDPEAASLWQRIEEGAIDVSGHVESFRREMNDVGAKAATFFILFGRKVERLFGDYLGRDHPNYVYCPHYSMRSTDADWVARTWRILEEYSRATAKKFGTPEFLIDDEMRSELERLRQRNLD